MPAESYASAVARLTTVLQGIFDMTVGEVEDRRSARALDRLWTATMTELERLTAKRVSDSEYEYQRRQAEELVQHATVAVDRG